MQFNQTNNNNGDVNNAVAENGSVNQSVGGTNNRTIQQPPKESFWGTLWKKIKSGWASLLAWWRI